MSTLVKQEPLPLEATEREEITPMGMLQLAVSQGADIEKLSKLMDLQERWEKNEARKAFVAAMAAFKQSSIRIIKDKENKQYSTNGHKAMYVSLGSMVTTVTPFLSDHGLSARWDIDQSSGIKVSCIITHSLGHSESVSMVCPPDKSGAKNPIQEIKSAITYAKACTFESICGLASTDANLDNDGNGSEPMIEAEVVKMLDWIENSRNEDELKKCYITAVKLAQEAGDKKAETAFVNAKNKRKQELSATR